MEQEEIRKELEGETKNKDDCSSLVLAKRYVDFEELESDNNDSFVFLIKNMMTPHMIWDGMVTGK